MKSIFTIVLISISTFAIAQIPQAISYQGIIINPTTGETAANGEHSVKFAFYNAATDGDLKWQTSIIPVTTFKGLFTTIIPVPAGAIWDQSLFVELTVDGMVLPTRVQLTTVPYAFKAVSADVALTMNASGLTGTIATSNLPAELQNLTTGPIDGSRVGPGINAANVDNGTLPNTVLNEHLQDLADGTLSSSKIENLDASKVTTGTFDPERIPNLDVSKITGLTPGGPAPSDIDAANITSGTLAPARLGSVPAANLSGVIANANLDEDLVDLTDGTLSGEKIGSNISAGNVTVGTLSNGVLDEDLQDLADGTLSGQKVGSNISAANLNVGTLPNTVLDADLQDLADDGVLSASRIENLNTSKLTAGTLPVSRGGTGVSTASNGQLLIGNGTGFNLSTLAAGTGININNSVGGITISSPQASGSTNGYLSSTDWTTFNNKLSVFPSQAANAVFAGPPSGLSFGPTFRLLVPNDIPGLDASKITSGTLSSSRLPPSTVTAIGGNTNRLAYFTSSTQVSANGLYWDNADNDLGINTTNPEAGVHIAHASGANHFNGTALMIENTYSTTKRGIDVDLTANGTSSAIGIEVDIDNSGTGGSRIGVASQVNTHASNASIVNGIEGIASGAGDGSHRGVYGRAESTGGGNQIGVFGEATTGGTTAYGVYGKAPATGYALYGDGKGHFTSDLSVNGDLVVYSHGEFNGPLTAWNNLYVTGNIECEGTVTADNVSDRKLKRDIVPLPESISKILRLAPSNYYFRTHEFKRLKLEKEKQYGLIAQDVEKIFPELVTEKTMKEKKDTDGKIIEPEFSYKALDYTSLIPILIKGMQEQQAMIDELKQKVERLEGHNKHNGKPRIVKASNN